MHLFDSYKVVNALSEFVNMELFGVQFERSQSKNIKSELDSTINYWVAKFQRSRTSCQDEHRSGRSNMVTTPEMVKKINKLILDHRRFKVHELADMVDISKSATHRIFTENSDMFKLCARRVQRLLTMEQNSAMRVFQRIIWRRDVS